MRTEPRHPRTAEPSLLWATIDDELKLVEREITALLGEVTE